MERREFCRFLGACTVCTAAAGLSGCARLLDRGRTSGDVPAPSKVASESPGSPAPQASYPDLALYQGEDPAANVRAAIAALGGMERFVARDARVVVKPNVMTASPPELGVTTNPQAVAAIVTMCFDAGAREVVVLDRSVTERRPAFEVSGILAAVEAAGGSVKFLEERNYETVAVPNGRLISSWPLCTDVLEADTFINVPIAKTHNLAGLTMSMKNLMGIMWGERGTMHQDFHQKIVDINTRVKPDLVVLDAYRMMVRNGPTGGTASDVTLAKTVIAGTSQVAVDALGATLFGWEPGRLKYLRLASEQGLGFIDLGALKVQRGQA